MLEKRHCKATMVRSEICTPAFAAESVRHFMRQVSCRVSDILHLISDLISMSDFHSLQEVDLAADVQRNLTAAISALEELEQHQNPALGPSLVKGGTHMQDLTPVTQLAQAALLCAHKHL